MIKKHRLIRSILIVCGFIFGCFLSWTLSSQTSAEVSVTSGGVVDSSTTQDSIVINSGKGGSLVNKGTATVYIHWLNDTVEANNNAGVNKCFLDSGDAVRIPSRTKKISHKTAAGTAKLIFVED